MDNNSVDLPELNDQENTSETGEMSSAQIRKAQVPEVEVPEGYEEESPQLTAEIDATKNMELNTTNLTTMMELVELAAHHLTLNNMVDDDPILNVSHFFNYILKNLNIVKKQGGSSPEMTRVLYSFKQKMVRGEGITREHIERWTANNLARQRSRGLLPERFAQTDV